MSSPEDIQRKTTFDRLLSVANAHKIRGEFLKAEDSCREALQIFPDDPKAAEMLGDALYNLGRLEDAKEEYHKLLEKDQTLAAVERKYAKMTLELDERARARRMVEEAINNPPDAREARRNAAVAMVLSAAAPGVGQIYNGEITKGAIVLGSFILSVLVMAFSSGTGLFIKQMLNVMSGGAIGGASAYEWPSIWLLFFLGVGMFSYIYAVIDAPITAAKRTRKPGSE